MERGSTERHRPLGGRLASRSSWLTVALWTGLALAAARSGVLFAMARYSHEEQLELIWMRLSSNVGAIVLSCLAVAVVSTAALALYLGRPRSSSPTTRRLTQIPAWIGLTSLFGLLLAGRLSSDRSLQVGTATDAGKLASVAVLIVAGALAGAVLVLLTRAPVRAGRRWAPAALPLAVAVLVPLSLRLLQPALRGEMALRVVVHELLLDPESADVVLAREDQAPHVGVLSPSISFRVDGADLPAWILPPPAEVRLEVPATQSVWLSARAGVDQRALERPELAAHRVRFELLVDDRERFSWEAGLGPERTVDSNQWQRVGGEQGLELVPGQVVTLRTTVLGPDDSEVTPAEPLAVGFGDLTLERRRRQPRAASSLDRPNIVLVVMDTQRANRLSAYGYERPTSPQLERLAARGLLFEQVLATSSWTWPSTASILTGMLPQEHGVLDDSTCYLAHSLTTLAERLQEAGYTTAAWSANPLVVPDKNFDQGFETFEHRRGHFRPSGDFMPAALDWIGQNAGTRFFLYLHLADPHVPHLPLPEGRALLARDVPEGFSASALHEHSQRLLAGEGHGPGGELRTEECVSTEQQLWMSQMYDACVWTGDYWLGRVVERLEELGLDDETVVVFTSDHGEELLEHGLLGHGQSLHGELVDVPLVLAGPGIPVGQRSAVLASNRHLGPTLARIAGTTLEGVGDALDLVEDASARSPVLVSSRHGWWNGRHRQPLLGARSGDLVLHFAPQGGPWGSAQPTKGGESRLYDLSTDPGEHVDLSASQPEAVERLREWILGRVTELEARRRAPAVRAGEATLEMLRQIGYLGN